MKKHYRVEIKYNFCKGLTVSRQADVTMVTNTTKKAMYDYVKKEISKTAKIHGGKATPKDIRVKILKEW